MTKRNALLSVFDKTGIVDFARELVALGWNLYSSGGTAKAVAEAGLPVTDVAELVGGEAILGHRVVTLSREVHAGLLARPEVEDDVAEMKALGLPFIDLVCFNLYPLAEEVAKPEATRESVIDKTDIGGPTALNSAAKGERIVIGNPDDYAFVLEWLKDGEPDRELFLRELQAKAFFTTSKYYAPAASFHSDGAYDAVFGERVEELKYGENAYMTPAALYRTDDTDPLAMHRFERIEGDLRSMVGVRDADRLLQVLTHLAAGHELNFGSVPLMAVGVKHGNAFGAAVGSDPVDVITRMVEGDKKASFGGVIMTNFPITREVAEALTEKKPGDPPRMFDGVFAPAFDNDAPEPLRRYQGKCRMMANPALAELTGASLDTTPLRIQVRGGYIMQPNYTFVLDVSKSEKYGVPVVSKLQQQDIVTAWAIGCVSNSNTITIVADGMLIGNGVGQQDRVGAAQLALTRAREAGHDVGGAVAWSDSFFPFPDGLEVLAEAGVGTIFASSGSKQDPAVIEAAKRLKVALLIQPDTEVRGFAQH